MKQIKLLLALAADCRDQGEPDIAAGLDGLARDVTELVAAIKAERAANDSEDSIAYLESRMRTSQALLKFAPAT